MKMKTPLITFTLIAFNWLYVYAELIPPTPATLDTVNGTLQSNNVTLITAIQGLVGGYGLTAQTCATPLTSCMLAQSPSSAFTSTFGAAENTVMSNGSIGPFYTQGTYSDGTPAPKTSSDISNYLTTSQNATAAQMVILKNECTAATPTGGIFNSSSSSSKCPPLIPTTVDNVKTFDMSNFINPLFYSDGGLTAFSFIQYASGSYTPPSFLSYRDLQKNLLPGVDTATRSATLSYIFQTRMLAAGLSVGLSNLYHLYYERVQQPNLGAAIGGSATASASPLQVEEYAAKRRLVDPTWVSTMETASPVTLQREMVYLLAELRLETFKQRMELERLEALGSISIIQQNAITGQSMLLQTAMKLPGGSMNINPGGGK